MQFFFFFLLLAVFFYHSAGLVAFSERLMSYYTYNQLNKVRFAAARKATYFKSCCRCCFDDEDQ